MAECNHVYPGCVCAQSDLAEKDAEIARLRTEKEALLAALREVVNVMGDPLTLGSPRRADAIETARLAIERATGEGTNG